MAKTIRDLLVRVGVNTSGSGKLTKMNKQLGMTADTARRLSIAMTIAGGTTLAAGIHFAKAGAEAEKSAVAFETMTGSAEKSAQLMREMEDFALETPFSFQETEKATKQLIAMGSGINDVMREARQLGDISAGLNVPMTRLVTVFGQIRAKGLLDAQDMRQFTEAGVPMIDTLARITGHTKKAIAESPKKLGITFKNVADSIEQMTSKGGRFNNLMEKMSKTMGGVASNVGVMWSLLSRDIGKEINKDLSPIINELFFFLRENRVVIAERISKALRGIIAALKGAAKFVYTFRRQIMFLAGLGFLAFLGKITLALGVLGKAFMFVGNRGLIAWLKMVAPLVLLGALVAALYLGFQDLWTAIFNPEFDSFTKDFLIHIGAWETFRDVVDTVASALRSILNTFLSIGRAIPEFFKRSQTKGGKFDLKQITRAPREGRRKEGDEAFVDFFRGGGIARFFKPIGDSISNYIDVTTGRTPEFAGAGAGAGAGLTPYGMSVEAPITVNVAGSNATPGQIGAAARDGFNEALRIANINVPQRGK